jgi:type I restriction enzyme M protein
MRYLNAEKRALINVFEKLWDKYAVSAQELEQEREAIMLDLNNFLVRLGFIEKNEKSEKYAHN